MGGRIYTTHNAETIAVIPIMTCSVYNRVATRRRDVILFLFLMLFSPLSLSSADIFVNDPLFHENGQISVRNMALHRSCVHFVHFDG